MRTSEVFPSRFLKGEDLKSPTTATIQGVTLEEFRDPKTGVNQKKPVCHFIEPIKPVIVNLTNWRTLAALFGDDSDAWVGHIIRIVPVVIEAFGKTGPAARFVAVETSSAKSDSLFAPGSAQLTQRDLGGGPADHSAANGKLCD